MHGNHEQWIQDSGYLCYAKKRNDINKGHTWSVNYMYNVLVKRFEPNLLIFNFNIVKLFVKYYLFYYLFLSVHLKYFTYKQIIGLQR